MKYEKLFDLGSEYNGVSGLFNVSGDFGIIDGGLAKSTVKNGNEYTLKTERILLSSEFVLFKNGAVVRKDSLKNISDKTIVVNRLSSRFILEGYDYEVFTQFNAWQHENTGGWQRLRTQVTTSALGLRTCDGANPIMGLYNCQNRKTTVFHLVSNCQWKMNVKRHPHFSKADITVLETGFEDSGLNLKVEPGETVYLPQIIFYTSDDKLGLSTDKMHVAFNSMHPRNKLPIMYNTWLCYFDTIDFNTLCRQVDAAADMGFEIFFIDAGWFGNERRWDECIGDWIENREGAFCGRMAEFSEYVRSKGMQMGLWLEPERALATSTLAQEHPEYLMHGSFMDYTRKEVREHLVNTITNLIEKYKLGAMKFDFNDTFSYDPNNSAFYHYLEGQKKVIAEIRKRYPELYISGCASGGYRTDLGQSKLFDSFWFSDNQGPREGLDIYKEAIKAVPPCVIEKWNVQTFLDGVMNYFELKPKYLPVSCNNGLWTDVVSVRNDYVKGFLSGGPVGFSCDLTKFPEDFREEMSEFIRQYKIDRDFFINAKANVICDTDCFIGIQYSDEDNKQIKIHLFSKIIYQSTVTIFPIVSENYIYRVNGKSISGKDLKENGITLPLDIFKDNDCIFIEVERI